MRQTKESSTPSGYQSTTSSVCDSNRTANEIETFHNVNITLWSSGSHERTVERKVEDLRRKLKTIVATLSLILPGHAHQDLVQHGAQCENLTTNHKSRPDCPEDMLRVHKGVNRLQLNLKELVFSFGYRAIVNNEKKDQNGSTMHTHVQLGSSWGIGERAKSTTLNKQTRTRRTH